MKNIRAYVLLAASLILPTCLKAQATDSKIDSLATAIARAEGFGRPHAIPTRYHNPGDLKSRPDYPKLPGQKAIGKGGHIIFKNDAAGWAALKAQITKMSEGRSHHFKPDMTLMQVAKKYAGNWRPWIKIVSRTLDVSPTTTLMAYLTPEELEAPSLDFSSPFDLSFLNTSISLPVLAEN